MDSFSLRHLREKNFGGGLWDRYPVSSLFSGWILKWLDWTWHRYAEDCWERTGGFSQAKDWFTIREANMLDLLKQEIRLCHVLFGLQSVTCRMVEVGIFRGVYALNEDGVFIFDVHSLRPTRRMRISRLFLPWKCGRFCHAGTPMDEAPSLHRAWLTFFVKEADSC